MSDDLLVDVDTLRSQVREKYRDVANDPYGTHHFHTGRPLASRLGYDDTIVDAYRIERWNRSPESATRSRCG